jgi:hypothetical protein
MNKKQNDKEELAFWSTGLFILAMVAVTIYALIKQVS